MDEIDDQGEQSPDSLAQRAEELAKLFETTRLILNRMIDEIGTSTVLTPGVIIAKLNELQAALHKVTAAEEAFHATQRRSTKLDIDFEAVRAEIGGQLDRLRQSILADTVSGQSVRCAACCAALSF